MASGRQRAAATEKKKKRKITNMASVASPSPPQATTRNARLAHGSYSLKPSLADLNNLVDARRPDRASGFSAMKVLAAESRTRDATQGEDATAIVSRRGTSTNGPRSAPRLSQRRKETMQGMTPLDNNHNLGRPSGFDAMKLLAAESKRNPTSTGGAVSNATSFKDDPDRPKGMGAMKALAAESKKNPKDKERYQTDAQTSLVDRPKGMGAMKALAAESKSNINAAAAASAPAPTEPPPEAWPKSMVGDKADKNKSAALVLGGDADFSAAAVACDPLKRRLPAEAADDNQTEAERCAALERREVRSIPFDSQRMFLHENGHCAVCVTDGSWWLGR